MTCICVSQLIQKKKVFLPSEDDQRRILKCYLTSLHSNPARRKETFLPLDSLSSWIAAKVSSTVDLFLVPPLSIFQLLFFQGFMINHWCKVLTSLSLSLPLYLHTVPSYIKKILLKEYKEKVPGARNQPGEIISYLTWSKCRSLSIFTGIKLRNLKCTDRPDWRNS